MLPPFVTRPPVWVRFHGLIDGVIGLAQIRRLGPRDRLLPVPVLSLRRALLALEARTSLSVGPVAARIPLVVPESPPAPALVFLSRRLLTWLWLSFLDGALVCVSVSELNAPNSSAWSWALIW